MVNFKRDIHGIMRDRRGKRVDEEVYITKKKQFRILNVPKEEGTCPICGQKKAVHAHHPVHRRTNTENRYLRELRIHICDDCENDQHPEAKLVVTVKLLKEILEDFTRNGSGVVDKYTELLKHIRKQGGESNRNI